jgi:hypothetical protein
MNYKGGEYRQDGAGAALSTEARERLPIFLRGAFNDEDAELPPRLTTTDLSHPESFHERLAAWLMKQH